MVFLLFACLLALIFRNGILLCDVAAAVTGHPVRRVVVPPASVREARANILVALDHLGLLGDIDEEQMVRGRQVVQRQVVSSRPIQFVGWWQYWKLILYRTRKRCVVRSNLL